MTDKRVTHGLYLWAKTAKLGDQYVIEAKATNLSGNLKRRYRPKHFSTKQQGPLVIVTRIV